MRFGGYHFSMLEADADTTLSFASALSTLADSEAATEAVIDQVDVPGRGPADLITVFASMHHAEALPRIGARLRDRFGGQVIGCTCEGVIGSGREVQDQAGLSVMVGVLPGATVQPFDYEQIDMAAVVDAPAALHEAVDAPIEQLRCVLLLADPFSTPIVGLLPAFDAAFPGVAVVGGMASGGRQARHNRLVLGDHLIRDGAVGLAISGDIDVQTTVSQGCRPVGRPMVITQAKRHILQGLGGRNALEAVQGIAQDLSPDDQHLLQSNGIFFGRVINEYQERFGRGDFLVRNVIGVDPDEGYIAINDPQVRVGQTVQLHVRDQKAAVEDFELLLQGQRVHGPGSGALLFSCTSRGARLFDRPNADATMVGDALGHPPLAGFFAAGELGPIGGRNFIHGHTASLAVFRKPLKLAVTPGAGP